MAGPKHSERLTKAMLVKPSILRQVYKTWLVAVITQYKRMGCDTAHTSDWFMSRKPALGESNHAYGLRP